MLGVISTCRSPVQLPERHLFSRELILARTNFRGNKFSRILEKNREIGKFDPAKYSEDQKLQNFLQKYTDRKIATV